MAQKRRNDRNTDTEVARIDKLFRELENDKTLPTFGDHFMTCLILGTAENVNLKKMYPKTYFKLSRWLNEHNKAITKLQKQGAKNTPSGR